MRRWFSLLRRDARSPRDPQSSAAHRSERTAPPHHHEHTAPPRLNERGKAVRRDDAPGIAGVVLEEIVLAERGTQILGLSVFTSYDAALWKRLALD